MRFAEGGKMKALRFARRPKDIRAVIQVTGPYETSKSTLIYTLTECVVRERELLDLAKAGTATFFMTLAASSSPAIFPVHE
jgi:hypothetical protein